MTTPNPNHYPQTTFTSTAFGPSLLTDRRKTIAKTTIHTQLDKLKNTGRYDCFKLQWHPTYEDHSMWPVPLHLFWDSDIAKWIEGAVYFLASFGHDEEVDNAIQELVEMIRGAQQEDGYLNVHYTVVEKAKRWSNLRDMHELYNAGHLIEAALAHHSYYKNNRLMEPVVRYVSLIHKTFGPGNDQVHGYPGHPEIELALLRLYAETGNEEAYSLAHYFLSERGNPKGQDGKHYYDWEREQRGEHEYLCPSTYPRPGWYEYCQAHRPIQEQDTVEGHSVRQMYLLTAVADMIYLSESSKKSLAEGEKPWKQALYKCWDNMVSRKMYLTGGIGSVKQWEGFGIDYHLPQSSDEGGCYAETCAAIAAMMLAERILKFDLNARFADVMELCLYNAVMTAMSTDGKAFTYTNQLGSSEADKSVREDWFWCACCPPNVTRLFGCLGGYVWHYGQEEKTASSDTYINVHLFTNARLEFPVPGGKGKATLEQKTEYPGESKVSFALDAPEGTNLTLRLRMPSWCKSETGLSPGKLGQDGVSTKSGYLVLPPSYTSKNKRFSLDFGNFSPRWISPHPYTGQRTLSLARGPIVYCVEDADNAWESNHFKDILVKPGDVAEEQVKDEKTGETYVKLKAKGLKRDMRSWEASSLAPGWDDVQKADVAEEEKELIFVPYYFRANRGGKGNMRVGLQKA
ncbi:DUF1680 domain [Zalerion maritima]|uniref:DUF1680 domain n=1 Tax=Zalerion maritima TaxID=339359 RepID=A0AAD5WUQ0_9PEZI|nr:DUF1680 domain [Zalerion maritima]